MDTVNPIEDRGGPAQPLLLAAGLRKHFPVGGGIFGQGRKVVRAVEAVSFDIPKGQTFSLVGESGCGKSTVARLLIRLIKPDRGTVVLDGDPVDEPHGITINELRRQVQMVFQDSYASLNPRLTIVETLAFAPKAHGVPAAEARERARDLLAKVGLAPFADRYPRNMSGGQQQRVAIARAMAMAPEIMLFDEVTSALDPELVGEVLDVMKQLAADGTTMIVVTHEMAFARDVADQVVVMDAGQVVERGAAEEVLLRPKNPRTASFLSRFHSTIGERRA